MAKRPNDRRAARAAKKDQRMNRATALVCIGFAAELYLLLFNRFFANGTVDQVVFCASFLEVMRFIGLGLMLVGAVLLVLRKKKEPLFARLGILGLGCGLFFAFSAFLMLRFFSEGTVAMCILVPVLTILGVVTLLYPAEFSAEAIALSVSIAALYLLKRGLDNPSWAMRVRILAGLTILVLAAMAAAVMMLQKRGGSLGGGKVKIFSDGANDRLLYGVLALCIAAVLCGMLLSGAAFYGIWALAVALFALAVYYTVKMM